MKHETMNHLLTIGWCADSRFVARSAKTHILEFHIHSQQV